jgi:ABC-type multidrug transport system fused ATPase/permease subunit
VHFERLVIESGDNSISFDLHPRLTVISGLGQMERDGLVNEFIGALGNSRAGVHLELMADSGSRFAVFRPNGAPHRVIDVDERVDVTSQFTDANGEIDLLSRAGLDTRSARRTMRFTAQDLAESTERDQLIQQLARVDQDQLWVAAEALRTAQRRLEEEADAVGSSVEDAAVIERIEQRHEEFERSQAASEQVRKVTFMVAGLAALLSLPVVRFVGSIGVVPLAVVALGAVGVSLLYWRRMEAARAAEEDALADAGAQSYLGFHLQRVNSLLSSDVGRRRLITAAEEHRDAAQRWSALAGDVDVAWATANQVEIREAARLRQNVSPTVPGLAGEHHVDDTAAIAHAVVTRLGQLRNLGSSSESFPALLDEPFANVDSGVLPSLLEIMVRASEHQQIVLLTESPTVASWAKVEAMTGAIGIIEPNPVARPTSELI